jgi:hypothetical protein
MAIADKMLIAWISLHFAHVDFIEDADPLAYAYPRL